MSGSEKDYKFGQKNHWRRTLWNDILSRTNGREKSEVILYLSGKQDLDREIATKKGVPGRNLIAVDRSSLNVNDIRAAGNSAICGEALDILRAWPSDMAVCAVVLDFCSGLQDGDDTGRLFGLLACHPAMCRSVVAMNFQRGRDKNDASELMREMAAATVRSRSSEILCGQTSEKHRGVAWTLGRILHLLTNIPDLASEAGAATVLEVLNPKYYSYNSGMLRFDSTVHSPIYFTRPVGDLQSVYPKDAATARKISATLAVRTRRNS